MSPERGDMGDWTNHSRRFLDRGCGFKPRGKYFVTHGTSEKPATLADISSPTEHVGTLAGTAFTPEKRRHKTSSEENKQFDPGGKGEKAPP